MTETTAPGPAVVFLLMTYNQQAFVAEAVRAALAQDHHPLTIVISDDASSDATFDTIQAEVHRQPGPHRVILNRNPRRMGSVNHLAALLPLIGGDFIVTAHGDDVSLPSRTRRLVATWQAQGTSLVSSNAVTIDAGGTPGDMTCANLESRRIAPEEIIDEDWLREMLGATLAFEPAVLSAFRRLSSRELAAGLDHVLPFRASLLKGFYYLAETLLQYRRHDGNMTLTITDRSGPREVFHETNLVHEMTIRLYMLDDIVSLVKAGDPALIELQYRLAERLIRDVRGLSLLRARLRQMGLLPRWIETAPAASPTMP